MNLTVLNKSRRSPIAGDIFVMLPSDELFLYGRVISTEAKIGPMSDCILIYIYRARSKNKEPVPEMQRGQLLVPPIMTNTLSWRRGYFELVHHEELQNNDILEQHCFRDYAGRYFDEANNQLPGPIEPVGIWGLHSYQTIDDEISKALGIELSP
jgi:immunity protein 26 of polymorphic toxin system